MSSKNVYEMYVDNGNKAGFFVRRDSWSSIYAKVISIEGKSEGPLTGTPRYFGNPEVIVDIYKNDGSLSKASDVLSCPGTFAYSQICPES
ncbi:hypothetical protein [Gimesia panareensis]|uniref:hypothetical protein n=1 Tax=Gimesia panareensis TaxID=2527978 RepID=UPI00119D0A26|nr:hypothetical protein [Gimesia panareensis]